MEFGSVTHAAGHDLPFERALGIFGELGFHSLLLLCRPGGPTVAADGTCEAMFPDLLASDPQHIRTALDNAGVQAASVHFSGAVDLSTDEGAEKAITDLDHYAALNLALGCRCCTHPVPKCGRSRVPTEEKAAEIARLAHIMNSVADRHADAGLRVAADIHYMSWVETLDDCRLLLDSMPNPNAGLILNIGHMTTCESYGWLLVDEYPDRIHVVGWKDHSLAKDRPKPMWSMELGTGHSPFELYARAMKAHPAERVHLVNCENVPDHERVDALRRSLAHMQQLWDRA